MMNERVAVLRYARYRTIAFGIVTAVSITVMLFAQIGLPEKYLFLFVSFGALYLGLEGQDGFRGYGVAKEINAIAEAVIAHDFGDLAWVGSVVKPLVRSWYLTIAGCVVVPILTMWLFPPDLLSSAYIYSAARLLALLLEVYVWFAADRYRFWFISEKHIRWALTALNRSESDAEAIVQRAKERNLLFE